MFYLTLRMSFGMSKKKLVERKKKKRTKIIVIGFKNVEISII